MSFHKSSLCIRNADHDEISIQEAATSFSIVLVTHLHNHNQLKVQADSSLKANHHEHGLLYAKLELTILKNRLRLSIRSSPRQFLQAMRAHNRVCKATQAEDCLEQ